MNIESVKQQQLALLARKALLTSDLDQVDRALGQLGAIVQFAEQVVPEPTPPAEPAAD